MRILIVEDDRASRKFLQEFLTRYGACDVVVDGLEALDAFLIALKEGNHYDLVCLDIMLPKVDGVKVLKAIRDLERQKGVLPKKRVKVIIMTALIGIELIQKAFDIGCEGYLPKPIDTEKLVEILRVLELI